MPNLKKVKEFVIQWGSLGVLTYYTGRLAFSIPARFLSGKLTSMDAIYVNATILFWGCLYAYTKLNASKIVFGIAQVAVGLAISNIQMLKVMEEPGQGHRERLLFLGAAVALIGDGAAKVMQGLKEKKPQSRLVRLFSISSTSGPE